MFANHYSTDVQKMELFLSDLQLDRIRERLIHTDDRLVDALIELGIHIDPDRAGRLLANDGFYRCHVCQFWDTRSNMAPEEEDPICLECVIHTWGEDA